MDTIFGRYIREGGFDFAANTKQVLRRYRITSRTMEIIKYRDRCRAVSRIISSRKQVVAELLFSLVDFFKFYSRDFTYNTSAISIRSGLLTKESKGWQSEVRGGFVMMLPSLIVNRLIWEQQGRGIAYV